MNYTIRRAEADDARMVALIKNKTWKADYAGILSPKTLDELDYEKQVAKLEKALKDKKGNSHIFVCQNECNEIVGYVQCLIKVNTLQDEDDSFVGATLKGMEIGRGFYSALYVLPEFQGKGAGKALFDYMSNFSKQRGIKTATGYCLVENTKGMNFHTKNGAKIIAEEDIETFGESCKEYKLEWQL